MTLTLFTPIKAGEPISQSDLVIPGGKDGFYALSETSVNIPPEFQDGAVFEVTVISKSGSNQARPIVMTRLSPNESFEYDSFLGYLAEGDQVQIRMNGQPVEPTTVSYRMIAGPIIPVSVLSEDVSRADLAHGGSWLVKSNKNASPLPLDDNSSGVKINLAEADAKTATFEFIVPHTGYYALHDASIEAPEVEGDALGKVNILAGKKDKPVQVATHALGKTNKNINTNIGYLEKGDVVGIEIDAPQTKGTISLNATVAEWAPRKAPLRVKRGEDGFLAAYDSEKPREAIKIPAERWVNVPAQDGDATQAIRQALAQAKALQSGESFAGIRLEKGATYTVATNQSGGRLFVLSNAQNIIIDGNGATLQMNSQELPRKDIQLFRTENCTRIAIADLTIQDQMQPYSVGEVLALKSLPNGNEEVTFKRLDGQPHPINDIARNGRANGYAYDPNVPGRIAEGSWSHYPSGNKIDGPNLTPSDSPNQFKHVVTRTMNSIQVGHKWVVKNKRAGVVYMVAVESEDITLSNIDGKAHGGGAVRNWDASVNLLNCRFEPQDDHWLSATSDGVHGRGRQGVWIEDTVLRGVCEDIMNTYSHSMLVLADGIETDNVYSIRMGVLGAAGAYSPGSIPNDVALRIGDELQFFNPQTGLVLGQARVLDIQNGKYTLSKKIEGIDYWEEGDGKTSTIVYNTNLAARFYIRDSAFMDSMRFGVFIKASHSVIFNTQFEGLAAPAIFVVNEPDWPEGPTATHLWLQGNTFRQNNYDYQSQHRAFLVVDPADISIYTRRLRAQGETHAYTSNLTHNVYSNSHMKLIGNVFEDWRGMGISVRNARNVMIADNTFFPPVDDAAMRATLADEPLLNLNGKGCYAAIFLDSVNGVLLDNNRFYGFSNWDKPIVYAENVEQIEALDNVSVDDSIDADGAP